MASYIFPTVCAIGIIDQDNVTTETSATKIFSSINANTTGLVIRAHSTNAADVIVGSSTVSTAGADEGFHLAAGDDLGVAITGPGADEFYQISANNTDNILKLQVG